MDELKTLLPGKSFTLTTGETIIVSPVPFGKLRIFSEAVAALLKRLSESGMKIESIDDWRVIFDIAFEEAIKIMSLVLGKPREWFDSISLADGLGIINIIIEQNFNENTKKNLKGLVEKLNSLLQTQSRPSSPQATPGEKSSVIQQSKLEPSAQASSS